MVNEQISIIDTIHLSLHESNIAEKFMEKIYIFNIFISEYIILFCGVIDNVL